MENITTPEPFGDFSPESLEASIAAIDQVEEFSENLDYDKMIVLSKKDLGAFASIVEPLTKQSVDAYGKAVLIQPLSGGSEVRLAYINAPYRIEQIVPNKSGKVTKPFCVNVSTLKRLVTQAFSSVILVEKDNDINIALCESLLYLETVPLDVSQFEYDKNDAPDSLDKEAAIYTFKKLTATFALTDRAAEKVVIIKDGQAWLNAAVFSAQSVSPFLGKQNMVIYKQVSDIIAAIATISTAAINYGVSDDVLTIRCGESFYAEMPVGVSDDKIAQFFTPTLPATLSFDASLQIVNDNLLRLVSVVIGLEYLADVVTLAVTDKTLDLTLSSVNQSKKSVYTFNIVDGESPTGEMKVTAQILKLFLSLVGTESKYRMSDAGLGIQTASTKILVRRS